MAVVEAKSKLVAYLLWLFVGIIGVHKFYLGKIGIGILYLLTGGILGIGWIIDLFTLGTQVDNYNLLHGLSGGASMSNQNNNNIVVNVTAPAASPVAEVKVSAEKQILALTSQSSLLTVKQVVAQTSLEIEEAESVLKKLVDRGLAKEQVGQDGKLSYDFS